MKKKLLAVLTLLVFCLAYLTGCNLIVTDTELDLKQVVATVGDEDYKDEITKGDILTVFVSNASNYLNQGIDASTVMEYFYNSLVNRRIYVQEGVKAIVAYKGGTVDGTTLKKYLDEETGEDKISERLKELLADKDVTAPAKWEDCTTDELKEAYNKKYRLYNTAFNSTLEAEEKQITAAVDKAKLQADENYEAPTESTKTERPKREEKDEKEAVERKDFKYRAEDGTKIGDVQYEEDGEMKSYSEQDKKYIIQAYKSYVSDITNANLFNKGLKSQEYITKYFEMMLIEQLEAQVISEHERIIEEQMLTNKEAELKAELKTRYDELQKSQKQDFDMSVDANISQIEGLSDTTYLLYNAAKGEYGFVKHILVKFDDAATLQVSLINSAAKSTAWKKAERAKLAAQLVAKDYSEDEDKPTKIAIAEYLTGFTAAFGGSVQQGVDNGYPSDFTKGTIYRATKVPDYVSKSDWATGTSKTAQNNWEIEDKFIDWEYAYSEDTGSITSTTDMLLAKDPDPMMSSQKYVAEFSEASRRVINLSVQNYDHEADLNCGYYTAVVTDYGVHIILCTDVIVPDLTYSFEDGLAARVIAGKGLTEGDKKTAVYKIFTAMKDEYVDANYSDLTTATVKRYKDEELVTKDEGLYNEIMNYAKSLS